MIFMPYWKFLQNKIPVQYQGDILMSICANSVFYNSTERNITTSSFGLAKTDSIRLVIGGFPIKIKTKIRYHIICCYHIFTL